MANCVIFNLKIVLIFIYLPCKQGVTQASPQALVLSVKSMRIPALRVCVLYIRCPALFTALNCTVCTGCTLEYNPVLCTQILVSPGSTINTEPQQSVSVNLAGEVKGGWGTEI